VKLPVSWLRSWVDPPWTDRELADRLTMLGFEVEALSQVAPPFSGVVVAEIRAVAPHPQADKLTVCRVYAGGAELQVVCGADNARAGLRSALAMVGARLPGDLSIGKAKLRGVESQGMLCSARELGLPEQGEGIIELPADAPPGASLREYLRLDESLFEISVTPNRGDAMSVCGIAREIAAASGLALQPPALHALKATTAERHPINLVAGAGCARFASRVIRGVDNSRPTAPWLRERLERSGLRSISPVVDVTNFVLLELGQPMHAYDLAKLRGEVQARRARPDETLVLLDGREVRLDSDVLVIADGQGAIGMAGIMGSERSAITAGTTEVLLESAWFDPNVIAGKGRRLGLLTDASQRFERGVDPAGQERALERACELLGAMAGGNAGPAALAELPRELPQRGAVPLRATQISNLLGRTFAATEVGERLRALGLKVSAAGEETWQVVAPSWRFDITIEADLIEELARSAGLDSIAEAAPAGQRVISGSSEAKIGERAVLQRLTARGYSEAVTFGFTDPALQAQLCGAIEPVSLRNPIAGNLSVMRASLWPGLLLAARANLHRQRERVRLFEIANRFLRGRDGRVAEQTMIGGVVLGTRLPEQWGAARASADYFDVKGDVTALLSLAAPESAFQFLAGASLPGLHPGRSAQIVRDGSVIGQLGELHPALLRALDFTYAPLLFELDYAAVTASSAVRFAPLSSFPQIRRDISFTIAASETFGRIAERVSVAASTRLHELRIFDVYQGKGVESGRKSVALGLILQDISRTLTDADADEVVAAVCSELRSSLDAKIRE